MTRAWLTTLVFTIIVSHFYAQETSALDLDSSSFEFSKAELLGQISPASHPSFSSVPLRLCSRSGIYLRAEVLEAFEGLYSAASDEGIELIIVSGMRNFNHQKSIWERKWERPRYMGWSKVSKAIDILTYSSMPGSSRHHWGTDFDLNSLDNNFFESGDGLIIYDFLSRCAGEFGFKQVYSDDVNRTGYKEEKWHWSYMPIADEMLKAYNTTISTDDFSGFNGSSVADSIDVIKLYVNGIDRCDFK